MRIVALLVLIAAVGCTHNTYQSDETTYFGSETVVTDEGEVYQDDLLVEWDGHGIALVDCYLELQAEEIPGYYTIAPGCGYTGGYATVTENGARLAFYLDGSPSSLFAGERVQ